MATGAEHPVLDALDRFGAALLAQDLAAMSDLMADDPEVTIIPSEGLDVHRGPAAVDAFLRRICAMERRYEWRWSERRVVLTSMDVAAFVAVGEEIILERERPDRAIPYCHTGIAVRRDGSWRFLVLHASEDRGA